MAKLKGPLFSLGAAGAIGKALVYFGWKGLNVVREYVIPSNPKTSAQTTQRGYLTAAVAAIHAAQALAAQPLNAVDVAAYALLGSIYATPRTWFNSVVKEWIDQYVAALKGAIYRGGAITPGATQLSVALFVTDDGANAITAGDFYYGTSKTALINTFTAVIAGDDLSTVITGLVAGTKYYLQFRPSAHADFVGCNSGIYYGTPT